MHRLYRVCRCSPCCRLPDAEGRELIGSSRMSAEVVRRALKVGKFLAVPLPVLLVVVGSSHPFGQRVRTWTAGVLLVDGWGASIAGLLVVAAGTMLLCRVLIFLLDRPRFLDIPNARSSHVGPLPRGGGLALMATIGTAVLVTGDADAGAGLVLLLGVLLGILGLADDAFSLGAITRLAVQLIVCGAAALALAVEVFGWAGIALVAVIPLALWLVGCVNSYNFMDGINGITGLHGAVAGVWFTYLGAINHIPALVLLGLPLVGACLGFLPWNFPRARMFLGDVGSYFLGGIVAGLSVLAWAGGVGVLPAVSPLLLYLADTGRVVLVHAIGRRPLHVAHRDHVYQRLADAGSTHMQVALMTAGISLLLVVLSGMASACVFVPLSLSILACYLFLPEFVEAR